MKVEIERRLTKRIELRRDVLIAAENSDNFHNARLINYSSNGICLRSAHPFQVKARIYIITENQPIDDFNDEFPEAYCADILWCEYSGAGYRMGVAMAKTDLFINADDLIAGNNNYEEIK